MMKRMAIGSPPPFLTPSALRLLAVANGNGMWCSSQRVDQSFTGHPSPHKANPAYKGQWFAPMIDNPAYKGEWAPRKVPNPNYFEDLTPMKSLSKIVRFAVKYNQRIYLHYLSFRVVSVSSSGP
jgi:Calreticulin family